MAKIIAIHAFARGTGKTSLVANLAALLAMDGLRVGVVDTELAVPGLHEHFGLKLSVPPFTLNDYLMGQCTIREAVIDLTPQLEQTMAGTVVLVPASNDAGDIVRVLRTGFDVTLLSDAFHALIKEFRLDVLLIDDQVGLNEASLACFALADVLLYVLRLDRQDYLATAVVVDVAQRLSVPRVLLIANMVTADYDVEQVQTKIEDTYHCEVPAVLPYCAELAEFGYRGVFAIRYPDHPVTALLHRIVARALA
jgi:MinD-like ATPase involved in chromosome partitioning or flagellar assembly